MRRLLFLLVVAFSVLLATPIASAQNTQNFTIRSFEADYYLSKTDKNVSTMKVIEKITAEFPNYNQNHGILRAIPKEYKDQTVSIDVASVTDEVGTPYEFTDYSDSGNLVLRIGDADRYVQGLNTYVITYNLENVISFYKDYD